MEDYYEIDHNNRVLLKQNEKILDRNNINLLEIY